MKLKPIVAAVSAAVTLLVSGAAQAAPSYSVTDLDTLGGNSPSPGSTQVSARVPSC